MYKKRIVLFILIMISHVINGNSIERSDLMKHRHCVVVILEAKQGKEQILKEELLKIMELSRQESVCLDYQVYEDLNNPTQFVLYEIWTSKEDHSKQFQKQYIIDFGNKLEELLGKPYQYIMAKKSIK